MIPISFIVYFLAVILLTATMVVLSHLLNPTPVKKRTNLLPFESGIVPTGSTDIRWNINYYLVAILFVIFDIEAIFLYVWTGVVVDGGWPGFLAVSLFIAILLIALAYEWRMGVLDWGKNPITPHRTLPELKLSPIPASSKNTAAADSTKESLNALETH